jgi:putative ABC transport system permease protein
MSLALKSNDALGTSRTVRSLLRELDPQLAVPSARTMDEIVWGSLGQRRFQLTIVLLFAGTGLLLASIGIYGVVAYSVAQRTAEIGVRMALGADATSIHSLVIRQAVLPLVPGLVVGVVASLAIQQLVASLVFDISPRDPLTIAAVCGLLTVIAIGAAFIPSRRATRISPVIALRYE